MQIFYMMCAIKFNISSTNIVLLQFQQKLKKKLKKPNYLINGQIYQKSAWNK